VPNRAAGIAGLIRTGKRRSASLIISFEFAITLGPQRLCSGHVLSAGRRSRHVPLFAAQ
jgi:hypothetical protein